MTFLDRIKETSTSTGTGAFTLGGAVLGYKVFTNGTYKYCIVNETESEWEVGEGTVTSGVLTRTTIEASSNGGAAVVFTAGTKYVFNTVSAAYVNSLVPYTGATANINLGAYNITATNIIRAGGLATQFLKADGSVDSTTYMNRAVYDTDGNGVVDAAEKMQTIGRNSTGVTLYKGTIVYISGSTGNRPNFVKAQANSEATSAGTFGVVVSDIANNSDGYVATIGTLADLDTRTTATNPFTSVTLADGDTLYLDPNTAGYVTNVKPSAPNHIVYVGKVVRTSPTLGTIVYRIQNGYELAEIHDVAISSVANNDVLVYESSTTLWKNKSIATILGYTPQAAITLTTTGSSGASTFVSNTLNIPTYTLAGLGGQPQLNGTGFVKATGTTISYDNTTYAADSLVVHLAGAETITGVKTFQNALQTTAGNNLLNTGGGNTVIGYTADPASSGTYKLDVNGVVKFADYLNVINATPEIRLTGTSTNSGVKGIYFYNNNRTAWVRSTPLGASDTGNLELGGFGANFLTVTGAVSGPTKISVLYSLEGSEFMGNGINSGSHYYSFNNSEKAVRIVSTRLGSFGRGDFKVLVRTAFSGTDAGDSDAAIYIPGSNRNVSINNGATDMGYALGVNGTFKATGVLQLSSYTTSSSVPGTVAGLLGFDSSGNVITTSAGGGGGISGSGTAGQVTYWSGTSAVTGSSNLFWDNTSGRLGIGTSSPAESLHITGKIRVGDFATLSGASTTFIIQSLVANAVFYGLSNNTGNFALYGGGAYNTGAGIVVTGQSNAVPSVISLYKTGFVESIRMTNNGNLMLQNGGTFNDGGQRLQVIGSMRVGTTAASAMYWDDTNARLIIGNTSGTARLDIGASTTSAASLRIRSGTAPTTPNEGDIWQDGTNIKIYIGGSTKTFTII